MFAVHAAIRNWDSCSTDGVATLKCLEIVFENLLTMSSALVIVILFIMFIVGSLKYLTSGGDQEKLKGARNTFKYAFAGLIIFVFSFLILNTIQLIFLGDPNDPNNTNILKFELPDTFQPITKTPPIPTTRSIRSCGEFCKYMEESKTPGKVFVGGVCSHNIPDWPDYTDCPNTYEERGLPDNLKHLCQAGSRGEPVYGKCCCE